MQKKTVLISKSTARNLFKIRCFITLLFINYHLETAIGKITKLKDPVDLTWPIDNDTIYWTKNKQFVFSQKIAEVRVAGVWQSTDQFCAGDYGGTYFDAPSQYNKWGWKVGEIPLSRLIVQGVKIDLSTETEVLYDETRLLPEHLDAWERKYGAIPKNCVILVCFGWSKYYQNKMQYLGVDSKRNLHFPGISPAAAQWIVRSGAVVGVGIDTARVDPDEDRSLEVHQIFSDNHIYVIENLKIPQAFPDTGFVLYVMPMKIQEGNGAPLRIIAIPFASDILPPNLSETTAPFFSDVIVIVASFIILTLQILTSIGF